MTILALFLCGGAGMAVTLGLIPVIRRKLQFLNRPDLTQFHHTHRAPVSRFGGLALVAAFVVVSVIALVWFPEAPVTESNAANTTNIAGRWVIVLSSLAMFGLGLWDDIKPLGARKKFLGQILIAVAACCFGVQIKTFQNPLTNVIHELGLWGPAFTVLWLVTFTNLINLIDGIDGLAGGVSLMLMGLLAYFGYQMGIAFPALCAAGMAGALLGFLRYNFPPAKIYMGDSGAYFLGYLIAILSIANSHKGTVVAALIAPLFVLALPIIDVSLAILRRGLKGLPLFRPDRKHIHHRLIDFGFSRTRAVLTLYLITLVFLLMAFVVVWTEGRLAPVLIGVACLILLLSARSFSFSREWFSIGRVLGNSLEMRKTTQYALTLCHWLEMEAERCDSIENLWLDFRFAAMKLGFSRVKLTLEDGCREWERAAAAPNGVPGREYRHEFNLGGKPVILQLTAEAAAMDEKMFEHLCDITTEAWHKSASRWYVLNQLPIRFDSKLGPAPDDASPRRQRAYVPITWEQDREVPPGLKI